MEMAKVWERRQVVFFLSGGELLLHLAEIPSNGNLVLLLLLVKETTPRSGSWQATASTTSYCGGLFVSPSWHPSTRRRQVVSSPAMVLPAVALSTSSSLVQKGLIAFLLFVLRSFM